MKWYEDSRAIGLTVIHGYMDRHTIFIVDSILENGWLGDSEGIGYDADYCRPALGDRTVYDGKGQPVPDGVEVKWWDNEASGASLAGQMDWDSFGGVKYYQVQEMPAQEQPVDEQLISINGKPYVKYPVTQTLQITPSMRDEVVECLGDYKITAKVDDGAMMPSTMRRRNNELMATIDKLTNQLKDLT